ncbi:FecR family protein [Sphingomonas parva]|nr:FecR family protein [Sphingomonas parva]
MRKVLLGPAALALLLAPIAAQAAPPPWTVSEVAGDVQLIENGKPRPALRGALLASGATIATAAASRAVIVRGKEFVVISPRSRLRVPVEAESAGGLVQMIADFGSSLFRIEKKSTPHFSVKTPFLAAVVKGTTFTVTVGAEGGAVQVTEGAVQVSTLDGRASEIIRPGSIASIVASDMFQLNIQGDVSKVIRSDGAAPTARADEGAPTPVAPVLKIAPMDLVISEESALLPMVAAQTFDRGSPAAQLFAELGSDAVDAAQAVNSSRDVKRPAEGGKKAPGDAVEDQLLADAGRPSKGGDAGALPPAGAGGNGPDGPANGGSSAGPSDDQGPTRSGGEPGPPPGAGEARGNPGSFGKHDDDTRDEDKHGRGGSKGGDDDDRGGKRGKDHDEKDRDDDKRHKDRDEDRGGRRGDDRDHDER